MQCGRERVADMTEVISVVELKRKLPSTVDLATLGESVWTVSVRHHALAMSGLAVAMS